MSGRTAARRKMRIAVEGCGHGTLHAIYASLQVSCRINSWDGVDLLIIGGDFQAVRNKIDLNVTSMPPKYRKMADFHEYYSGNRVAPCLTIFIGGNHEASNHLFELYYGGWVAPNIYYLGAANVLRLGPLRIAGLSGIWKGYDYRKPHYERLPYNKEEITTVFHVRELNVRKLLAIRTQVDIGLSHDWPQSVEWQGNYRWLFQKKDLFEADAKNGRLGSVAARHCLERLRPAHWFSAHLHIKYPAVIQHDEYQPESRWCGPLARKDPNGSNETASATGSSGFVTASEGVTSPKGGANGQAPSVALSSEDRPRVSAWQNFHVGAARDEAEETRRIFQERHEIQEEQARTGKRKLPQYTYDETFKQVSTNENLGRAVTTVSKSAVGSSPTTEVSNLDGCCESTLKKLKGSSPPQASYNPDEVEINDDEPVPSKMVDSVPVQNHLNDQTQSSTKKAVPITRYPDEIDLKDEDVSGVETIETMVQPEVNGAASSKAPSSTIRNVDEIEIDVSDCSDFESTRELIKTVPNADQVDGTDLGMVPQPSVAQEGVTPKALHPQGQLVLSDDSEEGGVKLNSRATAFTPVAPPSPSAEGKATKSLGDVSNEVKANHRGSFQEGISEEMRAQLASLSSNFADLRPAQASARLPLPDAIKNKQTRFLALDKCEPHREFLQLLEIEPISEPHPATDQQPFKLQYDKEWLAILRVFAPELQLGCEANSKVPPSRGDKFYQDRIIEEESWIEEHVVKPGLMTIPENFTITAPVYQPDLKVDSRDMPREYTNPQTSVFCQLIGIENKFDIPEEERDARMAQGPRPDQDRRGGYNNRGGARGGRGRGNGDSRGGHGGGRGWGRGGRGWSKRY